MGGVEPLRLAHAPEKLHPLLKPLHCEGVGGLPDSPLLSAAAAADQAMDSAPTTQRTLPASHLGPDTATETFALQLWPESIYKKHARGRKTQEKGR